MHFVYNNHTLCYPVQTMPCTTNCGTEIPILSYDIPEISLAHSLLGLHQTNLPGMSTTGRHIHVTYSPDGGLLKTQQKTDQQSIRQKLHCETESR